MTTEIAPSSFQTSLRAARAQHPGIEVCDEAFERFVRGQVDTEDLDGAAESLHFGDLLVAYGCAARDREALAVFERDMMPVAVAALRRIDVHDGDDLEQTVRERMLVSTPERPARITTYRGQGPLRAWLRVSAVREALSARRRVRPDHDTEDDATLVAAVAADPELELAKEQASEEFRTAFSEALAALPVREKTVLRYHVLDGLSTERVARIYRVHRVTVHRWLTRARQQLLVQTRKRLSARLGLSRPEFESLMTLIQSRLDVSLSGPLADGPSSEARP